MLAASRTTGRGLVLLSQEAQVGQRDRVPSLSPGFKKHLLSIPGADLESALPPQLPFWGPGAASISLPERGPAWCGLLGGPQRLEP